METRGENVLIKQGAILGKDVTIGNNVTIHEDAHIGDRVCIGDNAVIGKKPKLAAGSTVKSDNLSNLEIGDDCIIGTGAVLCAGTRIGRSTMVGDLAIVRERCKCGDFVLVGSRAVIENDVSIGSYTRIQTGAYITAYVTIEENVFIAPMVTTTNDNTMGRGADRFAKKKGAHICKGARVGGASIILPGIVIGEEAFVAAGSVVTRDVPKGKLVMGSPAKVVRDAP